jgi:hypothetical protein
MHSQQLACLGWCIVSSPLILAYNLSTPERRELVWDIITNKEAIFVNQAWDGHPGRQALVNIGSNSQVEVWTKPIGGGRTAAFIINTALHNDSTPHSTVMVSKRESDSPNDSQISAEVAFGAAGGGMTMNKCDPSKATQAWTLSLGVAPGDSQVRLRCMRFV